MQRFKRACMKAKQLLLRIRFFLLVGVTAVSTTACGFLNVNSQAVSDTVKYQGSNRIQKLAIPPSLSQPQFNKTYASTDDVPGVTVKTTKKGETIMVLVEPAIRIWERLGTTLPEMGMPIKGSNADKGIYTVSFTEVIDTGDEVGENGEGRLMKWLGWNKNKTKRTTKTSQQEYLILVGRSNGKAAVAVRPGKDGTKERAQEIFNKLKVELGGA